MYVRTTKSYVLDTCISSVVRTSIYIHLCTISISIDQRFSLSLCDHPQKICLCSLILLLSVTLSTIQIFDIFSGEQRQLSWQ
ncbi:unnamed protein product, partial [Candidula unifasciata]